MVADHRVIGLDTDKLLCVPASRLSCIHLNAPVNARVMYTDVHGTEYSSGRLLYTGGVYLFIVSV